MKFDPERTEAYINLKDWIALEDYVMTYLTGVQGVHIHPHPGLLLSIYRAQIIDLIENKNYDDASLIFNEKVKPLLELEDDLYKPHGLAENATQLEKYVNNMYVVFIALSSFGWKSFLGASLTVLFFLLQKCSPC